MRTKQKHEEINDMLGGQIVFPTFLVTHEEKKVIELIKSSRPEWDKILIQFGIECRQISEDELRVQCPYCYLNSAAVWLKNPRGIPSVCCMNPKCRTEEGRLSLFDFLCLYCREKKIKMDREQILGEIKKFINAANRKKKMKVIS